MYVFQLRYAWAFVLLTVMLSDTKAGTIVRFDTTLGDIDVRLYETATPQSVANFLNYVLDDDFDASFFHRAPKQVRRDENGNPVQDNQGNFIFDTFVLQGGGFNFSDTTGLGNVPTDTPVQNEPGISNLPGTIAYAKQGGDPNSATSGFFFNTVDNSENLDNQNGGFTVFGRIVRGFDTLNLISDLDVFDLDPAPDPTPQNPFPLNPQTFDNVPLLSAGTLAENLIFINDILVLNILDGDYDFDGDVDGADFLTWQRNVGSTVNAEADGNGNGVVDAADLSLWSTNYGSSAPPVSGLTTIPEPSSIGLACLGLLAALHRRPLRNC